MIIWSKGGSSFVLVSTKGGHVFLWGVLLLATGPPSGRNNERSLRPLRHECTNYGNYVYGLKISGHDTYQRSTKCTIHDSWYPKSAEMFPFMYFLETPSSFDEIVFDILIMNYLTKFVHIKCRLYVQYKSKIWNIKTLRGYCTPGQFLDCFCIFLENYNTLVTSKICFL